MELEHYGPSPILDKSFYAIVVLKGQEVLFFTNIIKKDEALKHAEEISKKFSQDCLVKVICRKFQSSDQWSINSCKEIAFIKCTFRCQDTQFEDKSVIE